MSRKVATTRGRSRATPGGRPSRREATAEQAPELPARPAREQSPTPSRRGIREGTRGSPTLVVGGAGFVGSNLVRRLLDDGVERVVVVDNFLSSEPDNIPEDPRVEVREGSIADDAVLAALDDEFEHVFHLATYHGNQSSIADPLADHENNLLTTLRLFERLRSFRRLERVVYASAGCVLAKGGDGTETEVAPLDLDSPYQISKLAGEMYALHYHRTHGLPVA